MLGSLLFWYSMGFLTCMAHVSFTNLKCNFNNATFGEFKQCEIKAINRTHKYISVFTKLYILPISNVSAKIKLMRYDHGYKPYFVDISFDACKYMKHRGNPLVSMFFNTFKDYTNINHTCPYDHDIIVDKFWTGNHDDSMSKYLPIRNGQYALFITFLVYRVETCSVVLYMKVNN